MSRFIGILFFLLLHSFSATAAPLQRDVIILFPYPLTTSGLAELAAHMSGQSPLSLLYPRAAFLISDPLPLGSPPGPRLPDPIINWTYFATEKNNSCRRYLTWNQVTEYNSLFNYNDVTQSSSKQPKYAFFHAPTQACYPELRMLEGGIPMRMCASDTKHTHLVETRAQLANAASRPDAVMSYFSQYLLLDQQLRARNNSIVDASLPLYDSVRNPAWHAEANQFAARVNATYNAELAAFLAEYAQVPPFTIRNLEAGGILPDPCAAEKKRSRVWSLVPFRLFADSADLMPVDAYAIPIQPLVDSAVSVLPGSIYGPQIAMALRSTLMQTFSALVTQPLVSPSTAVRAMSTLQKSTVASGMSLSSTSLLNGHIKQFNSIPGWLLMLILLYGGSELQNAR